MNKDRNAVKSGVFIIFTVVAVIAVIVAIKGSEGFTERKEVRAVSFSLTDDVGGLQVGDDVRVGGYKVGTIDKVSVVGAEDGAKDGGGVPRIRVEFTFPTKYALRRDALLRIQTTVTGQSCLNFESLGRGEKLPANEEIAGRAGTFTEMLALIGKVSDPVQSILNNVDKKTIPAVNETVTKFGHTADSFKATGDHATALIDDAKGQVDPAMKKYHALADAGVEALAKVRDFFGDTTPDFRATLKHVASITKDLSEKMPSMVQKVDGILTKVDSSIDSARVALEDVKAVAANTKDITASAKGVVAGNKGKFDGMIASLKTASDNLKNATAEIRRSPWRLLYKPAPNEMANLNLYDAAREFAEGANELNDASLALRDAVNNKDADKAQVEKLMGRVQKSFEKFQEVEQKLWTKVKE